MFHVHTAVAWLTPELKTGAYFKYAMKLSGMVAPVFMFLVGISIGLIAKRAARSDTISETKRRLSMRGLQIWLIGYGIHLAFYALSGHWENWQRIFKVDILHCIGLSMALAPWIAWPRARFNLPALLLFIAAPVLSMVAYRLPVMDTVPIGIAAYTTVPSRLALFPAIPYMAWIMLGLFIAPLFTTALEEPRKERRFWIGLVLGAVAMWFAGKGLKNLYYNLGIDRLGTDVPQAKGVLHFFWLKGAVVLGIFALFRVTTKGFDSGRFALLTRFGRHSLFAYCAHLFIIYPLLGRFLRRSLSEAAHLASTILLTAAMLLLVIGWEQLTATKPWQRLRFRQRTA